MFWLRASSIALMIASAIDEVRNLIIGILLRYAQEDLRAIHQYIEADLTMKEAALRRINGPSSKPIRFRARDRLLSFLEAL